MPSFMEIIDVTILGTAIASLIISVIKIKNSKKKSKNTYENKKDLR